MSNCLTKVRFVLPGTFFVELTFVDDNSLSQTLLQIKGLLTILFCVLFQNWPRRVIQNSCISRYSDRRMRNSNYEVMVVVHLKDVEGWNE